MDIINLPENLFEGNHNSSELQIANYEVYKNASKNKINLNKNVISFLLDGQKDIHFSNDIVSINDTQSLLISSSNFLLTEIVGTSTYRCLLFFFSQKNISDFLVKHSPQFNQNKLTITAPYFLIEKDNFIVHYINSLKHSFGLHTTISQKILELKFEEIMLYLANKYGQPFLLI
ncbi:hypothetical protein [Chryseobacterium sp.]|uniref:hypothetical protein n=1 Tax=Chryseobacterium sp. TaxID=1871047 RepID=UPI0028A26324|nr:hypothetical protein [Chryseobacterium sp.]